MKSKSVSTKILSLVLLAAIFSPSGFAQEGPREVKLLNVSYDPTRELYDEFNQAFAKYWREKTGQKVSVNQSHGGSGKQARAVIDGLEADVVTLALSMDIDMIVERAGLIDKSWRSRLPKGSAPYTSTIVFLVRKGNPKNIQDWDDLARPGLSVITPNPKTSGGARWNYLAAWGYANKKFSGSEKKILEFVAAIYKNVPVLDTGARGATTTFVERGIGDVLISWESDALLAAHGIGKGKFEIVAPSLSVLAEPPVAVVDRFAKKHGNVEVAKAYLEYLYSPEGQEIVAKHYYRPHSEEIAKKYKNQFPNLQLFTVNDFGDWKKVQEKHFSDGGVFDQIYQPG